MTEKLATNNFEQIHARLTVENLAETSLHLARTAMQFARVERKPRYEDGERESDVEHSYMLALIAPELARALELNLDAGLLTQFSIVHDLVELRTKDVATLLLSEAQLRDKEAVEKAALTGLLEELPPHTALLLERYESQSEPEARFVRFIDKLLPLLVDILGDGKRVMREDYGIYNRRELSEVHDFVHRRIEYAFGSEFPTITEIHTQLAEIFQQQYAA